MAEITTSQLTNLFQKVIDPMLRELHVPSSKSPLVRMWKEGRNGGEGTTEAPNNTFYITAKHSRHSNFQAQAEGATVLRGKGADAQPSFTTKTIDGAFTFSLKAKKASDSASGAIVDTLVNETTGMLERAKSQMAFYANNDGTGVICAVNDSTPNSQTYITIDGVRGTDVSHILDVGDSLHVGTAAERLSGDGFPVTVASIDSLTQITISETTSNCADDDLVYFSEAVTAGAENSKIGADGLLATSGTVQGIGLATALYYQAHVDTTAEVISENKLIQMVQKVDPRVKDASAFIVTMGDLWWKVVSLFKGTAQGDPHRVAELLNGGAKGLQFSWFGGSSPIIFDPYCRPGYSYGLDLNNIGYKQLWPLSLVDDASNMAHRITQKLEFEVVAAEDGNFYVIDPRANFKMTAKTTA